MTDHPVLVPRALSRPNCMTDHPVYYHVRMQYRQCAPATQRQTFCAKLSTAHNLSYRYRTSFLPKCPLTIVRSRFSADELRIVRGEALKRLLTVIRRYFGRKNEYRYLTYATINGNSFDRKAESINSMITHVHYKH